MSEDTLDRFALLAKLDREAMRAWEDYAAGRCTEQDARARSSSLTEAERDRAAELFAPIDDEALIDLVQSTL